MLNAVWAVITSFRPDESLHEVVASALQQTAGVVVVDDGSGPEAEPILEHAHELGALVVRLDDNSGIAAALNAGIRAALGEGADAIVTLDQDSRVEPGYLAAVISVHEEITAGGVIAGPVVPEYFADVRQVHGEDSAGRLLAYNAIQSGMLIGRDLFDAVGLFREDLFIDLVDTEFELRCLAAGHLLYAAPGLTLPHRLGARYRRRGRLPWPGPRVMTLSTPFRYFYRMRNRIMIERAYGRRFSSRLLRDGIIERIYFAFVLVLARPRRYMWAILRAGARAGHRGSGGRAPQRIEDLGRAVRWNADLVED